MKKGTEEKKFFSVGKLRLAYREVGRGETLVMIHGFPGPSIWRKVLPLLAKRLRCISIETLGLGDSEASLDFDFSLPSQAETIFQCLELMKIQRFHLLGHGLGAGIAQIAAGRQPDRIQKLILSDAPAYDNWPKGPLKRLIWAAKLPPVLFTTLLLLRIPWIGRSKKGLAHCFYDRRIITKELLAAYLRPLGSSRKRRRMLRRFLLSLNNAHTMEAIPYLQVFHRPTMILWSCENPFRSPSWGIRLYHQIPGAKRFELIPFSGLFSPEEKPDEFAQIVLDFIRPAGAEGPPRA